MVKFGRHLEAFQDENKGVYVVPYSHIRDDLIETEYFNAD